jgi:hypothetical protein
LSNFKHPAQLLDVILGLGLSFRKNSMILVWMDSILDSLLWIEELLPHDILMIPKHGGQTYYLDSHLVLILVERQESTYDHKGVTYPFDLWKGCIFPVEQKKQNAFFLKYVFLENHPVNKNWLFIPADSENFESEVKQMLHEISRRNPLLGIPVKFEGPAKSKSAAAGMQKKKTTKKPKADKKKENAFFLSIAEKKRF